MMSLVVTPVSAVVLQLVPSLIKKYFFILKSWENHRTYHFHHLFCLKKRHT